MPPESSRRIALFYRVCGIGFAAHLAYNLARDPVLSLWARHLGFTPQLVGILMGASTLTGVLTKFLFGALSDSMGRRRLLLLATAGLVAFGMTLTWPETGNVQRRTLGEHFARMMEGFREVFSSRPILVTSVAEALQFFATGLLQAMLPIYATEVAGLSPIQAGMLWGGGLAVPILSKPLFGGRSGRWGRGGQIVVGVIIGAAGVWAVARTTSLSLMVLG